MPMTKPTFIYGTAWKEEKSADLTYQALSAGFRAIDTANQRKHYFEEGVGLGIAKFLKEKGMPREELFLQTKFTYANGQDHRKPFDENDPFAKQVADSFASSLKHLQVNYVDSYVLHGPYRRTGFLKEDIETWKAMEKIFHEKKARALGVSNIDLAQLEALWTAATVKPAFVQNRCYANQLWDKDVRDFCKTNGVAYEGFSLLTANRVEIADAEILKIAKKHKKDTAQIIFRFSQQIAMIPMTGTTDPKHMALDLEIGDFELSDGEMETVEFIAG